ncbi:NRDE family protein [Tenacibaculum sp. 190524A02b]|uniref:Transport and Golgi organization protein 2 n=1 Tax=Tenacibaculum vairaonense TaxID=3137860 RepID=A0ABM9PLH6_9FLAO
MCTVTYLPLGENDFILTSNRDEDPKRKTISPETYSEYGVNLTYPKDALAGGTWIGLSEKNRLICLLNGGFVKHEREDVYKMSRGVIVKKLLIVDDVVKEIERFNFKGVEPFTIVLVDWNEALVAYELVWDGQEKYFTKLSQEPKIWSSSTLYTQEVKELRKTWFANWLKKNQKFTQPNIIHFHKDESKGTKETSLKMKRAKVQTVSITSVQKIATKVTMNYLDLQAKEALTESKSY